MAENPNVQQRLYDECINIKRRIGDNALTYDTLNEMKYAEMVIYEGLRMCPIATELKRRATKPYILENNNGAKITVMPGNGIYLPAFILQNDPKYFAKPSIFDPERFSNENHKYHVPGTYAPFGMGSRNCIGCLHPMIELKIFFYYMLLRFRFENVNKSEVGEKTSMIKLKLRQSNV